MTDILLSALLLSLVLLGIHAYFGLEIIRRGIIFTDLAISQMAGLGTAVALLFQAEDFSYAISVGFAISTAIIIGIVCQSFKGINSNLQEAFIGLIYVLGISGSYVLLSNAPHGMEVFQRLLATDILYSSFGETAQIAILYLLIGFILYLSKRLNTEIAKELIFFVAFAVTVTSSVKLAGVLVVFTLLVAPALMSICFGTKNKLIFAWLIGSLINTLSIVLSYNYDLPTGYTIVFLNALCSTFSVIRKNLYLNIK